MRKEDEKTAAAPLQQMVPPHCSVDKFGDDVCENFDLENAYIHFLRLLALGIDNGFQCTIKRLLNRPSNSELGEVSSGGIKSYERMYTKAHSDDDHGTLSLPRPSHNLDVVRCLTIFRTENELAEVPPCILLAFDCQLCRVKVRNNVFHLGI